jgi:hypothetical protein
MLREGWVFTRDDMVKVLRGVRDEMTAPQPEADGSFLLGDHLASPKVFAHRSAGADLVHHAALLPGIYGLLRNQIDAGSTSPFAISEFVRYYGQLPVSQ